MLRFSPVQDDCNVLIPSIDTEDISTSYPLRGPVMVEAQVTWAESSCWTVWVSVMCCYRLCVHDAWKAARDAVASSSTLHFNLTNCSTWSCNVVTDVWSCSTHRRVLCGPLRRYMPHDTESYHVSTCTARYTTLHCCLSLSFCVKTNESIIVQW